LKKGNVDRRKGFKRGSTLGRDCNRYGSRETLGTGDLKIKRAQKVGPRRGLEGPEGRGRNKIVPGKINMDGEGVEKLEKKNGSRLLNFRIKARKNNFGKMTGGKPFDSSQSPQMEASLISGRLVK